MRNIKKQAIAHEEHELKQPLKAIELRKEKEEVEKLLPKLKLEESFI